jgi:TolB-like protein/Flp pilus assembly protein TadD
MGRDEVGTHDTLTAHRLVTDRLIVEYDGRVVSTAGDSILAEFPSAVEAVSCAVEIQGRLAQENVDIPPDRQMRFRIGINLGDVIVDGADIFGDGVNVAARLQAMAEPGGICIAGSVHEQVRNKLDLSYRSLGHQKAKNIAQRVQAFSIATSRHPSQTLTRKMLSGAALGAAALSVAVLGIITRWDSRPIAVPTPDSRRVEVALRPSLTIGKPAVAVLPFANLSGDQGQEYFSDGLTEDLIAALGRFSGLSVIARTAVAQYKGGMPGREEVGRALNVAYLVEGSVRKAGDNVRVTAQLTDVMSGVHLWSDRFKGETKDVFAMQDEIATRIASALAIRVSRSEQERALAKPTESLAAYDLMLHGRERFAQGSRAANREARNFFERATALDPRYASAHEASGWTYYEEVKSGWTEFRDDVLTKAQSAAQRALELDPSAANARRLLGMLYLLRGQYELAIAELDRAIEINPSDAASHSGRGGVLIWSGRSDEAIGAMQTAYRLDPNLGTPGASMNFGLAYYLQARFEDAVQVLERGLLSEHNPLYRAYSYAGLAAAYAQLGRAEEAARALEALRTLQPFFGMNRFLDQFKAGADRTLLDDGLRKAGLY